jgi:hypothetical protein
MTTPTLIELRKLAEAVPAAETSDEYLRAQTLLMAATSSSVIIELLDALEAQAREIERLEALHVTTMMDELQPALEERNALRTQVEAQAREIDRLTNNFKVNLAAMHKAANERDAFKAELVAIRAQEPVAQFAEDSIFNLRKQPNGERWPVGTKLYASPVVDVNAGLVEDAARYRWWTNTENDIPSRVFYEGKSAIDAFIDSALSTARTQQAQKGGER